MKKIPKRPIRSKVIAASRGRNAATIFEPSNGGIGTKLKIAKRTLINTMKPKKATVTGFRNETLNLMTNATIPATKRLEAGPASATFNGPYL